MLDESLCHLASVVIDYQDFRVLEVLVETKCLDCEVHAIEVVVSRHADGQLHLPRPPALCPQIRRS
jgi:hypothetical protein